MKKNYNSELYNIEVTRINGDKELMSNYKDKIILVVNTATECGLSPQFSGLEELYNKYQASGLVILGFPCNQFGGQEPGAEDQIQKVCLINYGVSFPMFSKVEVNGEKEHPLFTYLKSKCTGLFGSRIKWNFTKFLIDSNGQPVKRYGPTISPENIESDIVDQISRIKKVPAEKV